MVSRLSDSPAQWGGHSGGVRPWPGLAFTAALRPVGETELVLNRSRFPKGAYQLIYCTPFLSFMSLLSFLKPPAQTSLPCGREVSLLWVFASVGQSSEGRVRLSLFESATLETEAWMTSPEPNEETLSFKGRVLVRGGGVGARGLAHKEMHQLSQFSISTFLFFPHSPLQTPLFTLFLGKK